jgi:hypothetical protein
VSTTGLSDEGTVGKFDRVWGAARRHARELAPARGSAAALGGIPASTTGFSDRLTSRRRGKASGRAAAPLAAAYGYDAELDGIEWDDEIDVVCVGTGTAAVAAALASRAAGLTTVVIGSAIGSTGVMFDSLGISDAETVEYLKSVTTDITPVATFTGVDELPIRFIEGTAAPDAPRHSVVTFVGASLRTWAANCLASPCSVLTTEVADPRFTSTYRSGGQTVEAVALGSVEFGRGALPSFDEWLADSTQEVVVDPTNSLQRLVFEDGRPAGAIIDTPSGPTAVRARFGIVLPLGAADQRCTWPTSRIDGVTTAELAFVTRAASRFARLELLVRNPRR